MILSMKILPFEKYEIRSKKSIDELCALIDQSCESWGYSFSATNKPLLGKRQDKTFKLYRTIKYRNSFLPIAFGEIFEENGTSVIKITLKMNIFVMFFMLFWLSFILFGAISTLSKGQGIVVLFPLGMFLFGYLMVQGGFWFEVPKLKKLIYEAITKNN